MIIIFGFLWAMIGVASWWWVIYHYGKLKRGDLAFIPCFLALGAFALLLVALHFLSTGDWGDETLWEKKDI